MRGIYVGRFQPFHNGHLNCVKYALKESKELVIVIAAAQYSHSKKNPFTAGERYEMILGTLLEEEIDPKHVHLIPAFDINDNSLWVYHLKRLVPQFDHAYSNNSFTTMLFQGAGVPVKRTPFFDREKYNATKIRLMIAKKQPITNLVPSFVERYLEKIDAGQRIRDATISIDDPREK